MNRHSEELVLGRLEAADIDARTLRRLSGMYESADRLIAAHPAADPETLEQLSNSQDKATVCAVARNPSSPPGLLISIAPKAPLDFFRNPALDLLILEDPTFLSKLRPGVLRAFLRMDECPQSWLRWAANYGTKGDQLEIVKRSDVPVDILKAVASGPHSMAAERAKNSLLGMGETW
jgi:hypothetical protein